MLRESSISFDEGRGPWGEHREGMAFYRRLRSWKTLRLWNFRIRFRVRAQAVVRVRACSLNYRDLAVMRGRLRGQCEAASDPAFRWRGEVIGGGAGSHARQTGGSRGRHLHAGLAGRAAGRREGQLRAGRRDRRHDGRKGLPESRGAGSLSRTISRSKKRRRCRARR